jgi:hypothetical protein
MAVSEVAICNSALIKLGVETITSLNDNSRQALLCKEQYPKIRNKLLYSHPWNFAMKRAKLVATATAPVYEFSYQYTLPSDCLRIWDTQYGPSTDFYQREGDFLYSNYSDVAIRYIALIADTTKYSPTFDECCALMLAIDLEYSLVQSNSFKNTLLQELQVELRDSRSFDAQENPSYPYQEDVFLNARR